MNYADLCTLSRELSNVSQDDYSDTRLLPFFNRVKDNLWSYMLTSIKENYNWDIWTTESFLNQSEYVLPEAATDTEWNLKINSVSINYDWETYDDGSFKYVKAKRVYFETLKYEWSYYANNQPKTNPLVVVADKSVFIAPHPKTWELWVNRIQLKGIKSIVDYNVNTPESELWLPSYLFDVLVQWVLPYIHRSEWRKDEASFEQKIYKEDREEAAQKFANRYEWVYYAKFPNQVDMEADDYTPNLN